MNVQSMRGYVVLGGEAAWPMLGALTPEQVAEMVFPQAQVRDEAGHNQQVRDVISSAARSGQLVDTFGRPAYIPGTEECSAAQGSGQSGNVKLAQQAGSLALTGINVAAATSTAVAGAVGAALGPATLGISALIGIFPMLFGHHAAAVKREQSVLCAAVPAANNYLEIIEDGVRTGKVTPQHGIDALNSLMSDFDSAVAPIRQGQDPTSGDKCNAACVMASELRTVVLAKQSRYQEMAAQQPMSSGSGPVTASPSAGGSTMMLPVAASVPSTWLPIGLVIFAALFLMREF